MTPPRASAKLVPNFKGKAQGATEQKAKPIRSSATNGKGASDMNSPMSLPNNQANKPGAAKANYRRRTAGVVPTALPMKRQPEGSVLTGGSTTKGTAQPHSPGTTSRQNMSKKLKGGAD